MLPFFYIPKAKFTLELMIKRVNNTVGVSNKILGKTPNTIDIFLEYPPTFSLVVSKNIVMQSVQGSNVNPHAYIFTNITSFTATHNLGRYVNVEVSDLIGKSIEVSISQTMNTTTIESNSLISGTLTII